MFDICSIVIIGMIQRLLFSLDNKPGWQPLKLNQTGELSHMKDWSIVSCSDHGPIFGGGPDVYIPSNASSSNSSFTNPGHTYSAPTGHIAGSPFTQSFLAGSWYFQTDEVEVFYETT
ncbi:uncharacterized protein LOC144637557 [Oculina patagonica]